MEDFKDAKVGDKVWSFRNGWGVIDYVDAEEELALRVDFKDVRNWYDLKGREHALSNQVLFWDEIKYEIPERPKRMVKKKYRGWLNINSVRCDNVFSSERYAVEARQNDFIACVKIETEYEVEEW